MKTATFTAAAVWGNERHIRDAVERELKTLTGSSGRRYLTEAGREEAERAILASANLSAEAKEEALRKLQEHSRNG